MHVHLTVFFLCILEFSGRKLVLCVFLCVDFMCMCVFCFVVVGSFFKVIVARYLRLPVYYIH